MALGIAELATASANPYVQILLVLAFVVVGLLLVAWIIRRDKRGTTDRFRQR